MVRMDDTNPSICPPPMSQVWSHETEKLIETVDEGLSGKPRNIAIISEYLAGRQDLTSKVECLHPGRVTKISLDSFIDDLSIFTDIPDADIIIVENCQFLFRRKINGFQVWGKFTEMLSQKEKIWITTWNIHAWRYLDAVKKVSSVFPVQIILTQKTHQELQDFILSQHSSSIFYVIDSKVPRRLLVIRKNKKIIIPYSDQRINLPYYKVRFRLLAALIRRRSHEIEPVELIFERLTQISNGNPGVALKIWEASVAGYEMRMSKLTPPSLTSITDPDTAYILSLIVSLEIARKTDLLSIIPEDIETNPIFIKLIDNGLVLFQKDRVCIEPLALAGITYEMKRIRMVW